jgi:hypothetical protein
VSPRHLGFAARIRQPGSPRHLAVIRIVFAAHLATVFASPAIPLLREIGGNPHWMTATWFPAPLEAWCAENAVTLAHVGLAASLLMLVGLLTRPATIVVTACFLATQHYWYRSTVFHDDWLYFTFFLLVMCFARTADAWSVDASLRPRPAPDPTAWRWPVEVMIAWFALLYVAAGVAKLFPLSKGVVWLTGTSARELAVEFVQDSPVHWLTGSSLFDYRELWPFGLASVGTVCVELSAITLVLTHRWRVPVLVAIVAMHLSIWSLGIPGFVQIALVSSVLFFPPEAFAGFQGQAVAA